MRCGGGSSSPHNPGKTFESADVATRAPVLVVDLPGCSRYVGLSNVMMQADGRTCGFRDRLEMWPVEPMDDTASEMVRRLGV